jgi:transposase
MTEVGWEKWTPKSDKIEKAEVSELKRGPQGRYTKELREEAVKLVTEEKLSLPEAARRLSLPPSTLGNWIKKYKEGRLGEVGKKYRPLTEIEMELARTKKELAEVKMKRDILKKAAAYFARESLPGAR